jgi:hypothetical protein
MIGRRSSNLYHARYQKPDTATGRPLGSLFVNREFGAVMPKMSSTTPNSLHKKPIRLKYNEHISAQTRKHLRA